MPYTDFSLQTVTDVLGLAAEPPELSAVPAWLREMLDRGLRQVLLSEKARSEFIVVPSIGSTPTRLSSGSGTESR